VTVVMATHNRASMLAEAVASVERQETSVPFEAVIVDNASSDGTPQVLAAAEDRNEWLRALREPRRGKSYALNAGVEAARGRILLFTDDDVVAQPGWIEAHVRFLGDRGGGVVAGGRIEPMTTDGGPWPWWFTAGCTDDVPTQLDHGPTRRLEHAFEYVWGANLAMAREAFDRFGPWNPQAGTPGSYTGQFPKPRSAPAEDVVFNDRVRELGGEVWFVSDATVRHRVRAGEVTPRRIVMTAYSRGFGEYSYRRQYGAYWSVPPVAERVDRGPIQQWALLVLHLLGWLAASVAFRIARSPRAFDRARRAALSASWVVAGISERSDLGARVAARLGAFVRRASLRLVESD